MNTFTSKLLSALLIFIIASIIQLRAQVVYFNGLGRALVTAEKLDGNVLKADSSLSPVQPKDISSNRKSTDGYTLFDLGINAQPNEALRASAILRVRNEFGGFYGDGSDLRFRQLRLDGIISKMVKYEIGDIDLELTPYTLFNPYEMYHDYESQVFVNRRSIVDYENFNFGNKWRMQGVHSSANFRFSKGIEKLGVRGFATRTRRTDYQSIPDRLIVGGRLDVLQSQYFQIGTNFVRLFDLPQTAPDTSVIYTNNVFTIDAKGTYKTDNIELSAFGEWGTSRNSYLNLIENDTLKGYDYFYDAGLSARYIPLNLKLWVSYRDVGFDFTSPTAQTRRIWDFGANIAGSGNYTTIFNTLQNYTYSTDPSFAATKRVPTLLDRMSDEYIRNLSISTSLMPYLPQYNNVTPYGQATPNRKGLTIGASGGSNEKVLKADATMEMLNEIVAVGNSDKEKRKFTALRGGALFNINRLMKYEKIIALSGAVRIENTQRGGVNAINFKSMLLDAGITVETVKQLDLILGYKMLSASGREFVSIHDASNQIQGYTVYDIDEKQGLLSYGLRYRFSKNTYFTAQGFHNNNTFKNSNINYGIRQLFLGYTMIF